jgi:CelD/BcsL family acetyltransferase involved in cellulose biosynthesis
MEFHRHHNFDEIGRDEWNGLVSRSLTNVPFLQFGYLKNWWQFRGGGEWPQEAQLEIFSARDETGLIGIAPLFRSSYNGEEALLLIGSIEISDYLDFIAPTVYMDDFLSGLFSFLQAELPQIGKMILVNIPQESHSVALLKKLAEKFTWSIQIENAYHTPVISLAADWETYLMGIDKKQRHEIRRKLRGASQQADIINWYFVTEKEKLTSEFEDFLDMMAQNPCKKEFLEGEMRSQLRAFAQWAFDQDMLELSFLTINGQKASAYLCFDYEGRIYVYNSGYDINFASYSPGWVHLSYLIRDAIEKQKTHFDFMRGDETYKYRFGAVDGFVMKAILTRETT